MEMKTSMKIFLIPAILFAVFFVFGNEAKAENYYASSSGEGTECSINGPCKIASFWLKAKPGDTLYLLDGIYRGDDSMIQPPIDYLLDDTNHAIGCRTQFGGTEQQPLLIKALNDGKATIDGQGVRSPVKLACQKYIIVEGLNAHSSDGEVFGVSRSDHITIRRCIGWDGGDVNVGGSFGAHYSNYTLFEDVAGWGIARKIFDSAQGGNYTTFRRAWGSWDGKHWIGPKMTYTMAYNHYNMTCENCIGTWRGLDMKQSYYLGCSPADTYANCNELFTDYSVDQPYGVFSNDGFYKQYDNNANAKILGSIAYIKAADRVAAQYLFFITGLDSIYLENDVAYIEPGSHLTKNTFRLQNDARGVGSNLTARNLTAIGGAGNYVQSHWDVQNSIHGNTLQSLFSGGENVFNSSRGAKICNRYQGGILTSEPLWPWPMNQRILDAMIYAGKTPVDVTAAIESMLGPIPSECKVSGHDTTPPSAPTGLVVQ